MSYRTVLAIVAMILLIAVVIAGGLAFGWIRDAWAVGWAVVFSIAFSIYDHRSRRTR